MELTYTHHIHGALTRTVHPMGIDNLYTDSSTVYDVRPVSGDVYRVGNLYKRALTPCYPALIGHSAELTK